jgi:hypothetical protein
MILKSIHLLFVMLLLSGCATAPMEHNVDNTKLVNKPFDKTWQELVRVFASNHIQIKNIAKDSGLISAESTSFNESQADCGSHGLYIPVRHSVSLNVFVASLSQSQTSVTVNAASDVAVQFQQQTVIKKCNSTGIIEKLILDNVS